MSCSSNGDTYIREMKLTGCNPSEFTCSGGHCIDMEQRCNQVPDCPLSWDVSDELNCKTVHVHESYSKEIPPVRTRGTGLAKETTPVQVKVSLTLKNVVAIEEEDHSISLKFRITMEWKDNRVTYQNLKRDWTINTVREEDVKRLWLPLLVYTNTDQQETTRLGEIWEWSTILHILREGQHSRNSFSELEEAFTYKGERNEF